MKSFIFASFLIFGLAGSAMAQDAPKFLQDTYPEHALQAALEARGVLEGEGAALDAKTRELISLGVSAQIPCTYCVYAHTNKARALGASDAEIREAVAAAATTRQWSTVLNGMQYDLDAFQAEYDELTQKTN
jgi:AhpD family alkylhydroperoxidase